MSIELAHDTADTRDTIDESLSRLADAISDLMFDTLKHEQRHIADTAAALKHSRDASMFRTVYAQVRTHFGKIQSVFEKLLQDACSGFVGHEHLSTDHALHFCTEELALITDSELAQQLRLEKSFAAAGDQYAALRLASGHTFLPSGMLLPCDPVLRGVEPGALAWSIQHALASLIDDQAIVRVLYRFIGAHFFSQVGDLYEQAVPVLARIVQQQAARAADTYPQDEMHSESDGQVLPSSVTEGVASRPDIVDLLRKNDIPAAPHSEGHESLNDIALDQLRPDTRINTLSIDEVLDILRRHGDHESGEDLRDVLRDALARLSSDNVVNIIDRVSENILNLVAFLFAELNDNSLLLPAVRKQLQRLRSTITQVALVDTSLFRDDSHPVREYLAMTGRLGALIRSDNDAGFRQLRHNISMLLKGWNGDVSVFSAAAASITRFLNSSEVANASQTAATATATAGHNAHRQFLPVRDYLDSMTALLSHELSFHKLAKFVFSAVLSKVLVRHGHDSTEWKRVTDAYSNVLWSTQASATDDGKRRVLRSLPGIVRDLRGLCLDYAVKDSVRELLLSRLFDIHMHIIRGQDGALIEESTDMIRNTFASLRGRVLEDDTCEHDSAGEGFFTLTTELPVDPRCNVYERFDSISDFEWAEQAEGDDTLQAHFRMLEQLPLTTVLEFDEAGITQRFMLKEKSVTLGRYTFISGDRSRMLTLTRAQLAAAMLKGEARRIEDDTWFERGMEQVFRTLKLA